MSLSALAMQVCGREGGREGGREDFSSVSGSQQSASYLTNLRSTASYVGR